MADNYKKSALGFEQAVKNNFSFLKSTGFRCTLLEPTIAKFESQKVNVTVYFYRFEIDLAVEQIKPQSDGYHLGEILQIIDHKNAEQYKGWMASTPQSVAEGIQRLAEQFKYCLRSGIFDVPSIFSRLKKQREISVRDYALNMKMRDALRELELAWKKKNFPKVIKILSPLQEHLNPTELKKLKYAKKHFKGSQ